MTISSLSSARNDSIQIPSISLSSVLPSDNTCHYFADEAGGPNIFADWQEVNIGAQGCSRFFMFGVAYGKELSTICDELEELRSELVSSASLLGIASLAPGRRKTAIAFHAKNDHPASERVFDLLSRRSFKVVATIRCKYAILEQFRIQQMQEPNLKFQPNSIYDLSVERTFAQCLHNNYATNNHVILSQRNNRGRKDPLSAALRRAQARFCEVCPQQIPPAINCELGNSETIKPLQIVDYCLWALQRLYERQEAQYFEAVRKHFALIVDADDTREKSCGQFYSCSEPLSTEKIWSCPRQ